MPDISRRSAIGASLAIAATPLLPSVALAARPGVSVSSMIEIAPDTLSHKFTPLAAQWCIDQIRAGLLYYRMEAYFDYSVKLTDPHFKIKAGKKVWNWMTGYTEEEGVAITVYERGVALGGEIGISTSIGYEEYWEKPRPEGLPDYQVRRHHIPWEEMKEIEPRLPKEHMRPDMRWLDKMAQKHKEETLS